MPLSPANEAPFNRLLRIFNIEKKSALDRYCRKLTIYSDDFTRLITLADNGQLPYRHNMYHREIVPNELKPTMSELPRLHFRDMSPREMSNLFRRLGQVIQVRRQLVAHVFYDADVTLWHFFYFDQRDTSADGNHWGYGSHIHLINYLCPNHDPVLVLKEFLQDKPKFKGSLHIRFVDKTPYHRGSLPPIE